MSPFRQRSAKYQEIKALGRSIGGAARGQVVSDIDGDGDGFVTGPDGKDNIPAPIAQATEAVKKVWDSQLKKQLADDERRSIKAAQAANRKPVAIGLERLHSALIGARRRDEVRDAQLMVHGFAKSIFELDGLGDNGEYKSRLLAPRDAITIFGDTFKGADMPDRALHVKVNGEIVDRNGNRVGIWERKLFLDSENVKGEPHVYHESLVIFEKFRGSGVGADFTLASEARYKQAGMKSIYLNAGLSGGAYAWSRAGYTFVDDNERKRFVREITERLNKLAEDAGGIDKLIKGGFDTPIGTPLALRKNRSEWRKIPKDLLKSREEYDTFMKLIDEIGKGRAEPATLTVFPRFAKEVMSGLYIDMKKPVRSMQGQKALIISGLDKILGMV